MTLLELETGGMWRGAALEEGGMCQAAAGRGTGLVWAGAAKSVQCGLGWVAGTQVEGGLGGAILGVILNGLWSLDRNTEVPAPLHLIPSTSTGDLRELSRCL